MLQGRLGPIADASRTVVAARAAAKRLLDISVSAIALLLMAPFWALIALAIVRDSPGPVFYRGPRAGKGGRTFGILKFRTMYERPESYAGPRVTAADDPRVTSFGRWLRDTKLNELPQFWNVLIGEMSLVGPRPEDPEVVREWPPAAREEILSMRPGITSPASVLYRDEESQLCAANVMKKYLQELTPDKMRLDQLYVRYHSFCLDLDTMLWTVLVLMPMLRFSSIPEGVLFLGPITRLVRRHVSWFVADLLVTLTAIGFAGAVWRAAGPLHVGWPAALAMAVGFALLFSLTGALMGVHRIAWDKASAGEAVDLLPAWFIASATALALNVWRDLLPVALVILACILALLGFVVVRYRSRLITGLVSRFVRYRAGPHYGCERVLIVGSGERARQAAWALTHEAGRPHVRVVGFVDPDPRELGMRIYGGRVVGTSEDVSALLESLHVSMVVLADPGLPAARCESIENACRAAAVTVVTMPSVLETLIPNGSSGLTAR